MHDRRSTLWLLVVAIWTTLWTAPGLAQTYPNRAIRLVVPFSAGGPVDVVARLIAERLSPRIGQPVIVENKPGAGSLLGIRAVLDAPADGYTLLLCTSSLATTTLVNKDAGYKVEDFVYLAPAATLPIVFVVNPALPARSVAEFVDYVRQRPGKTNYSTMGPGSFTELLADRFTYLAGLDMVAVPYKGGPEATTAVVAGETQLWGSGVSLALPLIKAGKLRPLAVANTDRATPLPDVPTFKELGYPEMLGSSWFAVAARATVPGPAAARLREALGEIVYGDEYRQKVLAIGLEPWTPKRDEIDAAIQYDLSLWQKDVKRSQSRGR